MSLRAPGSVRRAVVTACVSLALCLAAACASPVDEPGGASSGGTAPAGAAGSGGSFGQGGSGGGDPVSPCKKDDAYCDWPTETCACGDCKARPECGYAPCVDDGNCKITESCQCPDCHDVCGRYCEVDGICIPEEWCGCADCQTVPNCKGVLEGCDDAPGICGEAEPCDCPDCVLAARCTEPNCTADGACNFEEDFEWCICPDCQQQPECDAEYHCFFTDGFCDFLENCNCPDCANAPGCSHPTCNGIPNGVCASDEPCSCVDCFDKEECVVCNDDGVCGGFEGCICADCEGAPGAQQQLDKVVYPFNSYCYPNSGPIPCVDDGVCHPLSEGCGCKDCFSSEWCADNVASCVGGGTDGTCAVAESCLCPDCWWGGECALDEDECDGDGVCEAGDSWLCPECAASDGFGCEPNGVCNDWYEGCDCVDCANAPTCP